MSNDPEGFYPGFERLAVTAGGVRFAGVAGGDGPPLLLLHGFPETHIAWRKVAPALAGRHRLIIPDLPGYGASRLADGQGPWTKRQAGQALAELMTALGYDRFALAGHDRGARVAYRLALDLPARIERLAALAVIPTLDALQAIGYREAARHFHWFFLAQPADLPERLLAADPDAFLDRILAGMTGQNDAVIEPAAHAAYLAAFRDPAVRQAICEDYRAALADDLAADEADRRQHRCLACPVLCLWPGGTPDPAAVWRNWADDVQIVTTGGGHLQMEERPAEVIAALTRFFGET